MKTLFKSLFWCIGIIFLLLLLLTLYLTVGWQKASQASPILNGSITAPDAPGNAQILRDQYAVPHIFGDGDAAVLFALGFAHAQDRFWQMDITRRAARGTLSEVIGALALETDIYHRTFGFVPLAERSLQAMPENTQQLIAAYADGVNSWLDSELYVKPAEFILTATEPNRWEPVDSLLVTKMLWMGLAGNMRAELRYARIASSSGEDIANEFAFPYPTDGHVAMSWPDLARTLGFDSTGSADYEQPQELIDPDSTRSNSNNWVVGGSRTVSGAPMLANDPHLGLTMPGFWYLAHLDMETGAVVGATIPGVPAVVLGRNNRFAWGATNSGGMDVMDTYLVPKNEQQSDFYPGPNGREAYSVRTEEFNPRFGRKFTINYKSTRHGPVFPQRAFGKPVIDHENYDLALSFTALMENDLTLAGIMAINSASNFDEIKTLRKLFAGPPQNIVMASSDGDIGLMVAATLPIRHDTHETHGAFPADGTKAINDWQGTVPDDLTPLVINPEADIIVTANAKIVPDEYPFATPGQASTPYRQQRAHDLAFAIDKHTPETFKTMQMDAYSIAAQKLVPLLLEHGLDADHKYAVAAVNMLASWDFNYAQNSAAPLIFATWKDKLHTRIVADELGEQWEHYKTASAGRLLYILTSENNRWCDDITTELIETCQEAIVASFEDSLAALETHHGAPEQWRWGDVYRDRHRHFGLGSIPVIGSWLSRETRRPGGPDTLNVGYHRGVELPEQAGGSWGPSFRMVVDMASPEEALYMISSGQSGHFGSVHYDDLQQLWELGDYIKIPTQKEAVTAAYRLTITPAQ